MLHITSENDILFLEDSVQLLNSLIYTRYYVTDWDKSVVIALE